MTDAERVANRCRELLYLVDAAYGQEYGYGTLPLCVIDAIWSIGVRYESVKNVVQRYCRHFRMPDPWRVNSGVVPTQSEAQHSIPVMLAEMRRMGLEQFTENVFQNRQRTSPQSGILKADAVFRFAAILESHQIHFLKDVPTFGTDLPLECKILAVPGQASGKSLKYFFMLCGDASLMKPDRMTLTYLSHTLGKRISDNEAQELLSLACSLLHDLNPSLTPRLLDHEIWKYQRSQ